MFGVKSNEMNIIDRYMIETVGLPSLVLMENASKTIVDEIVREFPLDTFRGKSIVVLCGTGNNGGDGLCVARWLIHLGYNTRTIVVGEQEKFSDDAKKQFELLTKMDQLKKCTTVFISRDIHEIEPFISKSHLVIDALIGTGCNRIVTEPLLSVVTSVNKSNAYVLSVDIPTGINSDNGKVMGKAIKANTTVTFCLPKLGLLLNPGTELVGNLIVTDIGIIEEALETLNNPVNIIGNQTLMTGQQNGIFNRKQFSHKGTFGSIGIIAGDKTMLGATILAAKACYKSGAGLVKVFVEEEHVGNIINSVPECVVVTYDNEKSKEGFDERLETFVLTCDVVLIGPGLSKSLKARHLVSKVLQMDTKVVLDADALNIISEHMEWFEDRVCEAIITPHIGEMARLTGYPSAGISENTLQFAQAFSEKYQVTTILKSARTVIVSKNLKRYINMSGNSGLATAGSGDVLAGVVASILGQGYNGEDAAVYGVLLHSMAGDVYAAKHGEHSLISTDIINNLWEGI